MNKILITISFLFLFSCTTNIEDQSIKDAGIKQISDNLFLKKIYVGDDRIYILINEKDEVVSGNISSSYTIRHSNGKSSYSTIKSNTFINLK